MRLQKTLKILTYIFPLLLIVPNVALDFTEHTSVLSKLTNVALPLGLYYIFLSLWKNVGRTILFFFPLMIYAAFQLVLLYLFGEGLIAIDMFINVVTTNFTEATELLGNLTPAIILVCVLYLPPIFLSIVFIRKKFKATPEQLKHLRIFGFASTALGIVLALATYVFVPNFSFVREIFPGNVMSNSATAVKRFKATQNYENTSADFSFNATSQHPDSLAEIYVLVVGETSRAHNWQLMGYDRPTNPQLSKRNDILAYKKALTESNTTHKSVPMLLSCLDAKNFGDSIYYTKSVLEAFSEAGYRTAFLSNQRHNHSFIDFFGEQADNCYFVRDKSLTANPSDSLLLTAMTDFIHENKGQKLFIVLHTYGSHFNYKERYERADAKFLPDDASEAASINRDQLINAYDNTIIATDRLISNVISELESLNCPAAIFYASDHGEDIFDDKRERFLHASPSPTYWQIHVPLIVWTSPAHKALWPQQTANLRRNLNKNVSSTKAAFHTIVDLAGLKTPYFQPAQSLASKIFTEPERFYVTDYNEAVKLSESGLTRADKDHLSQLGISCD